MHRSTSNDSSQLLKQQGNAAFAAKQWDSAIDLFGQAIALDPTNHVLFSNRSAAYAGKKDWDHALEDAEKVSSFGHSLHVMAHDADSVIKTVRQY